MQAFSEIYTQRAYKVNESALNQILGRIKAKDGQSINNSDVQTSHDDPRPETQGHGSDIAPGTWVEWRSPLFGTCGGKVALVEGDQVLIEDHPITHGYHGPVWIHRDWIVKGDWKDA